MKIDPSNLMNKRYNNNTNIEVYFFNELDKYSVLNIKVI